MLQVGLTVETKDEGFYGEITEKTRHEGVFIMEFVTVDEKKKTFHRRMVVSDDVRVVAKK